MSKKNGKPRRVFLWVFLAIQVIFIVWLIAGLASAGSSSGSGTSQQAVNSCNHGQWRALYRSQARCEADLSGLYAGASDTGTAIGAGLVIGLWVATDVIVGGGYGIYRLARRPRGTEPRHGASEGTR